MLYVLKWPASCQLAIETLDGAVTLKWATDPVFDFLRPYGLAFFDSLQDEALDEENENIQQVFDDGISKN